MSWSKEWPVAAFEHYMYADDRPGHPMNFFWRATFAGVIDFDVFAAAVQIAADSHPLVKARIKGEKRSATRDLRWTLEDAGDVPVYQMPELSDVSVPGDRDGINLQSEPGMRFFVWQKGAAATVLMQIHHATADGAGSAKFLDDVLCCYDSLKRASLPEQISRPSADLRLMAGRGEFHMTSVLRRRQAILDVKRILGFFRRFPAPLKSRSVESFAPGQDLPFPAMLGSELSFDELRRLKTNAKRSDATVNDLLLHSAFLALHALNLRTGAPKTIRIAMPINMRRHTDHAMPSANIVSMCFLDRSGGLLNDPGALLESIRRETAVIKENYLGYALIRVAELFGRFRGGMQMLLTPRWPWRCATSAVVSNCGEPVKWSKLPRSEFGEMMSGGLILKELAGVPPIRPFTAVSIGAVTYAGRLRLTLHFDPREIVAEDAAWTLDRIMTHLKADVQPNTVEEGGQPLPDTLVAAHRKKRVGATSLRSLPIGKNVRPHLDFLGSPVPMASSGFLTQETLPVDPIQSVMSESSGAHGAENSEVLS